MASQGVIDLVRARLSNLKEQSKVLAVADHHVLRGRFREILVESLLEPYLPPTVELVTGTIIGANGEKRESRNEDDIVVFDHSRAPLLLKTRGRDAIIPITGVRCHIEVKTNLADTDLSDSLSAALELNRMSIGSAPTGVVFAYGTKIAKSTHIPDLLLTKLKPLNYKPAPGQTTCPIQAICIFGRGSWFLTRLTKDASGWYEVPPHDDRELLAFVSILSNSMFGNGLGLGTHVLDTSWLIGPKPEMQDVIPKEGPPCA